MSIIGGFFIRKIFLLGKLKCSIKYRSNFKLDNTKSDIAHWLDRMARLDRGVRVAINWLIFSLVTTIVLFCETCILVS